MSSRLLKIVQKVQRLHHGTVEMRNVIKLKYFSLKRSGILLKKNSRFHRGAVVYEKLSKMPIFA